MIKPYYQDDFGVLYHGDCLEIMPQLDIKADMVLCDPPYGSTACSWDSVIPFEEMWASIRHIICDNRCVALFGSEPFSSLLRCSNIKNFKYDWIWDKKSAGNIMSAKHRPLKRHETISIFNSKIYLPIFTEGEDRVSGATPSIKKSNFFSNVKSGIFLRTDKNKPKNKRYPYTILDFSVQGCECNNSKRIHPTQKPVALMEYLIRTYTNEGETILDFACGSGTTGVAAINTLRKYILIEKEEKYCEIAAKRLSAHRN